MRAGSLKDLATIQRQVQMGVNDINDPNFVWHDWHADVFCEKTSRRGKEHYDATAHQRFAEVVYQFMFRLEEVDGIDPTMRVVNEDQSYDIKSILPGNDGRYVIIECTISDSPLLAKPLIAKIIDTIPDGVSGVPYGGFSIKADGGKAPYAFGVLTGSLPPGMSIDMLAGSVSGTPSSPGVYPVTFSVTDSDGDVASLPSLPLVFV